MSRRGAALLVVLWVLVALSGVATLALAGARTGVRASSNRLELLRAGWGAEACLELQKAQFSRADGPVPTRLTRELDSVDLGRGLWCRITVEEPATRVQVNLAPEEALHAVLNDSALVRRLLALRPLPAIEALRFHHGFDSGHVAGLSALLTVRGSGVINLNGAGETVLLALPGVDAEAARRLVERRRTRPFASLDEALSVLPSPSRNRALRRYPELVARAVPDGAEFVSRAEGRIGNSPLVARVTAIIVPTGDRLAVIRREVE